MRNLCNRTRATATSILSNNRASHHSKRQANSIALFSTQANVSSESATKSSPVCPFHFDKLVNVEERSKLLFTTSHIESTKYQPFSAIPGPRPSLPLLGTNWTYLPLVGHYRSDRLLEANVRKFRKYGPIMKEEFSYGQPVLTLFDPSDIKQVFKSEESCPARPTLDYIVKHRRSDPERYSNIGLANMMGKEWQELRSKIAPFLLSRELKNRTIVSQHDISSRLVEHVASRTGRANKSGQRIIENVQDVFSRYSMESIMNLCVSDKLNCLRETNLGSSEDGELILEAAMKFFVAQHKLYYGSRLINFFDNKPYKQLCESQNTIHDIASKYIDRAIVELQAKARGGAGGEQRGEETILESLHKSGKFSDLDIKGTIVDFVVGGIYTLSNTLTMALFLLAANQVVQDKLYREICDVFPNSATTGDIYVDQGKLEHLRYLKLCMKESYRMLPTIPGIARILQRDLILSNYHVPKNTLVFCNSMTTCRLPEYFDEPDEFRPNRWDRHDKNFINNRNPDLAFALLPFGHGVRKCVGHNFAELQTYIALTKLIRTYKIETINGENADSLELDFNFIVVPRKPVKLKFTPRNDASMDKID